MEELALRMALQLASHFVANWLHWPGVADCTSSSTLLISSKVLSLKLRKQRNVLTEKCVFTIKLLRKYKL